MDSKHSLDCAEFNTATNLQWQQIFDSLQDLIAVIDLDHRIIRVNKAMADLLGVSPDVQTVAIGAVIIGAVYVDVLRNSVSKKVKVQA